MFPGGKVGIPRLAARPATKNMTNITAPINISTSVVAIAAYLILYNACGVYGEHQIKHELRRQIDRVA
jgi:hypothetical protein